MNKTEDLAPGTVRVQADHGWLFVEIGRGRYVKRFNLSTDEAAQLAVQLAALLRNGA
jgi:hypothetical protein